MVKIQHLALNEIPAVPPDVGSIIYLRDGSQYITTNSGYLRVSDIVFVEGNLPQNPALNKIYLLTENNVTKTLIYQGSQWVEISSNAKILNKNIFIFFTNKLSTGEVQTRAKIPYNSKITKVETILSKPSSNELTYSVEKSNDGVTFTPITITESIPVGQVLKSSDIINEVLLDKDDILRIVMVTDNQDAKGLTVNIAIEEV